MTSRDDEKPSVEAVNDVERQQKGETTESPGELDVAARFLASLGPEITCQPITDTESRRLLWKIDLIILPILAFSVIMAAVDKIIISNAAIYGMVDDTNLKENEFSWIGSIFYFGFLVAEWPGNFLIQKLPIRTFYGATVFGWAVLTFMTAVTSNFGGLAAVRFLSKSKALCLTSYSALLPNMLLTIRDSGYLRSGSLSGLHGNNSHVVDDPGTTDQSSNLVQQLVFHSDGSTVLWYWTYTYCRRALETSFHRPRKYHNRLVRHRIHLPP